MAHVCGEWGNEEMLRKLVEKKVDFLKSSDVLFLRLQLFLIFYNKELKLQRKIVS